MHGRRASRDNRSHAVTTVTSGQKGLSRNNKPLYGLWGSSPPQIKCSEDVERSIRILQTSGWPIQEIWTGVAHIRIKMVINGQVGHFTIILGEIIILLGRLKLANQTSGPRTSCDFCGAFYICIAFEMYLIPDLFVK